ncbi:MAG: small subunit ribosomal protein S20 [Candidatus Peregrinibacteria bacterium Greene0416_19]|nr:MAG: small subunit ribosomal protein S20 [Candidatus Peregrinibacteria bacterium Greene0416_19]
MPITKSALKASRQSAVRRKRRLPFKTHMKTMMRKLADLIKEGKKGEAVLLMPQVYKSIDTAAKKHLIHRNNADRKKSLVARMVK